MKSSSLKHLLLIPTLVLLSSSASLADESDSYSGYDSIIKELSASNYTNIDRSPSSSEIIRFHAGFGFITSRLSLKLPKSLPDSKTLRGYEARFGIDLFSPNWVAEAAIRSFEPSAMKEAELSMREFDLLVIYNTTIRHPIYFNIGGGMSARYLDVTGPIAGDIMRANTTPASVLTTGMNARVTTGLSIGAQVSYRNPLVKETIDSGSLDGSVRLTGRF